MEEFLINELLFLQKNSKCLNDLKLQKYSNHLNLLNR